MTIAGGAIDPSQIAPKGSATHRASPRPSKHALKHIRRDSNAPKKPLSAYMIFSLEVRPAVKESMPSGTFLEISKGIADRWNSLTDSEKAAFNDRARAERLKYDDQMRQYKATPEYSAYQTMLHATDTGAIGKGEKPAKVSGYLIFSAEQHALVRATNPALKLGEIAKIVGKRWKDVSSAEKNRYNAMANAMNISRMNAFAATKVAAASTSITGGMNPMAVAKMMSSVVTMSNNMAMANHPQLGPSLGKQRMHHQQQQQQFNAAHYQQLQELQHLQMQQFHMHHYTHGADGEVSHVGSLASGIQDETNVDDYVEVMVDEVGEDDDDDDDDYMDDDDDDEEDE